MGYIVHHSITVTSYDKVRLQSAHLFALSTGAIVSDVTREGVNGFASFLVAPDGSKEGWEDSAAGDARRAAIKTWLREQAFGDNSNALDWFEVEHPEDGAPRVVDHQRKRQRKADH